MLSPRSRRLRRITQTEALIILAIMRKPHPVIVLLDISSTNSSFQAKHCLSFLAFAFAKCKISQFFPDAANEAGGAWHACMTSALRANI